MHAVEMPLCDRYCRARDDNLEFGKYATAHPEGPIRLENTCCMLP